MLAPSDRRFLGRRARPGRAVPDHGDLVPDVDPAAWRGRPGSRAAPRRPGRRAVHDRQRALAGRRADPRSDQWWRRVRRHPVRRAAAPRLRRPGSLPRCLQHAERGGPAPQHRRRPDICLSAGSGHRGRSGSRSWTAAGRPKRRRPPPSAAPGRPPAWRLGPAPSARWRRPPQVDPRAQERR